MIEDCHDPSTSEIDVSVDHNRVETWLDMIVDDCQEPSTSIMLKRGSR